MPTSLPIGLAAETAVLLDERGRPDFRDVFGTYASKATEIATAVTRVRLSTFDLTPDELGNLEHFRVLVAEVNAIRLTAEARGLSADPRRGDRLDMLSHLLESGRLEVRAAPLAGWSPDFTVFRAPGGPSAVLAGDVLTISGSGAEWVFDADAPVPDSEIVGTTWVLDTYIDGDAATNMPMMELATLTLNADGTLDGSTSCRRLEGEWITAGATIQFTSLAAIDDPTAGVCAPESETLDGLIISVLESGVTVEVDGNRLTLMAPGDEGLSYIAG